MEPASRGLRLLHSLLLVLLFAAPGIACAAQPQPYFTLSTTKTFVPGEKPKLHLYARNVDALEFRIYHIQDPEAFTSKLQEMHSFGDPSHAYQVTEQIDEKTWLERFHDWKRARWHELKEFFRTQFSRPTRDAFKAKQSGVVRHSVVLDAAQFAQIPLLNDKQLVARWRQEVPPTFVSDNQVLPIDPLNSGMYLVEATDGHLKAYTVLLVSRTALITRLTAGQVIAFAVDRTTGAPVAKAAMSMQLGASAVVHKNAAADGTAVFTSDEAVDTGAPKSDDPEVNSELSRKFWLMARNGDDIALVAPFSYSFTESGETNYLIYAYTDRPVYRPGNVVHYKAIIRERSGNNLVAPAGVSVHVNVADEAGTSLLETDLTTSAMGTVQGDLTLPKDAGLGYTNVTVTAAEDERSSGSASFRIEEYRKPEYQVRLSAAKDRILQGDSDAVTINARYFFGEPVANAKVKYRITQNTHFWYTDPDDDSNDSDTDPDANTAYDDVSVIGQQNTEQTGRLDADGKLVVNLPTTFTDGAYPDQDYVIEAGVTDEAGREILGRYRVLATRGSFRLQVEPVSYFAQKGSTAAFRITAVDYDNHPVQTRVHLRMFQRQGSARGLTVSEQTLAETDATTGGDGTATATVPVNVSGSVLVEVSAKTPENRTVQEQTSLWVNGGDSDLGTDETQQLRIVADKKSYAPGDTAHLSVVAPVADFHALVTATGKEIAFRKVLDAHGKTLTFDLPIGRDAQPNLTVDAVFLRDDKLYSGRKNLNVPPTQQRLQISITPAAQTFQPGQAASYDVTALDFQGRPVQAELSFGVVDEAIYGLYPDTSGDIVKQMYPDRTTYPDYDSSIAYYFMGEAGSRSPQLAQRHTRYGPQLAQVKPGNDSKSPRIRKDFPDTAFWQPAVRTDASGHARLSLSYPDSLTTWRATVRAITADSRAGSTVNRVIVRKNVIVRMGQPRFVRKGDTLTVPVIVHNYLQTAQQVQVSLQASGLDQVQGDAQTVSLQPRADTTVNYKLHASTIGTATLTAKAIGGTESDALQVSFPVEPDGVKQAVAQSGALSAGANRDTSIAFPAGTDPAAHTLHVTVAPSIAGTLFGALRYLTSFPYGCTEQTMSSFLPDVLVSRALGKLGVTSKQSDSSLKAEVDAGLQKLTDTHHADGGWGWWQEDQSQVFMTAYVVIGLQKAREAGFNEASADLTSGIDFLTKQLQAHPRMLPDLRAYVVYALALAGHTPAGQLDTLYGRRNDLSPEGLAYTGMAMRIAKDGRADEMANVLERDANVQGEIASWKSSHNNLLDVDSSESAAATAMALKFLLQQHPGSPLVPKAAQWLAANRNQGEWWGSTQDTAFVLDGLTDYVAATHELDADMDVDVMVNGQSVAHRHFSRADALQGAVLTADVPATQLQASSNAVRISTRGTGRAYWSVLGNFYSTAKSNYQQGTMQLNVARDYFRLVVKQTGSHQVYTLQPLRGAVQQGDILAVHVGVTGSPQKYLLIEDPIAAGTEFVRNRDSYNIQDRPGTWTDWYTRQEFHDDRAAFFSTTFSGRQDLFYLVQVVNPGSYTISPARVAPMYQPGVQATTDALHLDVQEVTR